LSGLKKRPTNANVSVAEENLRGTIIKSVLDYRFNSNKSTHMFLFVESYH